MKTKGEFIPPSVEEVQSYLNEKGIDVIDAEQFVSFYESKGWRVGRSPMVNWHAAVATWVKRRQQYGDKRRRNSEVLQVENFDRIDETTI